MRRIQNKNTKPEVILRSALHRAGYRFRIHVKDLPGKPDIVFPSKKKIVFVHGCFWHVHPDPKCLDARLPNSRQEYWIPKLERTKKRDQEHITELAAKGWETLVVWECELKQLSIALPKIIEFLER